MGANLNCTTFSKLKCAGSKSTAFSTVEHTSAGSNSTTFSNCAGSKSTNFSKCTGSKSTAFSKCAGSKSTTFSNFAEICRNNQFYMSIYQTLRILLVVHFVSNISKKGTENIDCRVLR
jgi:hypothetical protein